MCIEAYPKDLIEIGDKLNGMHAAYYPSYGPEMRGGTANCTIVLSNKPIRTPIPEKVDVLIALNTPSLLKFQDNVTEGGTIIVNSSSVDKKLERRDVFVAEIPANEIAQKLGTMKVANMVVLGSYIKFSEDSIVFHKGEDYFSSLLLSVVTIVATMMFLWTSIPQQTG